MEILEIPLSEIVPNPLQPRKSFRNIDLLAESIKINGLINPISVERLNDVKAKKYGAKYMLISGERRLKAHELLGIEKIWAIIKKAGPYEMIAENTSRDDMSLLEKMEAICYIFLKEVGEDYKLHLGRVYNGYKTECEHKVKKICSAVGLKPSSVYNYLAVLDLPKGTKRMIIENRDYFTDGVVCKLARVRDEELNKRIATEIRDKRYNSRDACSAIARGAYIGKGYSKEEQKWDEIRQNLNRTATPFKNVIEKISIHGLKRCPDKLKKNILTRINGIQDLITEIHYGKDSQEAEDV